MVSKKSKKKSYKISKKDVKKTPRKKAKERGWMIWNALEDIGVSLSESPVLWDDISKQDLQEYEWFVGIEVHLEVIWAAFYGRHCKNHNKNEV